MPVPSDIVGTVAVLMNDYAQTQYTNSVCLPFLNLALAELQEIFELNGLPVTNEESAIITIPYVASPAPLIVQVGFNTVPSLPADMIEIQELWESPSCINQWTRVDKKDFLPKYLLDSTQISQFLVWAWEQGQINLIAANQPNDLRLDYTANMFNLPITIGNIGVNLPFTNIGTYLDYKTASLAAFFIAENESRSAALNSLAETALNRAIGIPVKGMQSITIRRKPFRFSFKHRGTSS